MATGYPQVEATCRDMGIVHDDWQQGLCRLILAKRADGRYAATVGGVGLSIPRQVGKTFTVGSVLFALAVKHPGMLVLWTAHRTRTANETFRSMKGMAGRSKIKPFVRNVRAANGEQEIEFHTGSRILFGAREQGFGRGFASVDVIVFDEAQILTDAALEDMIPATNQASHPAGALLFFMGTPPRPKDPGEAFKRMRAEALAGEADDLAWVEMSADPDVDGHDWAQVAKANPSFPQRPPRDAILRMRKRLGDDSFRREGLGVWDEDTADRALSFDVWRSLADPRAERGDDVVFGMDVAEDRSAWLAVAWQRDDGRMHVQLVDAEPVPAYRIVERAAEVAQRWDGPVVPPKAFAADLEDAGADVLPITAETFPAACGAFADLITSSGVTHGNQTALNDAVKAAVWRPTSNTTAERAFQLKDFPQVGPLVAAVRAVHGLSVDRPSVYEERGLVTL